MWREPEADGTFDPYKIMVSEIMLQQTQVNRVTPKYINFICRFPSITSLAHAPLGDVLHAWSGLGYNRRAKFLHQAAKHVSTEFGGVVPSTETNLVSLPGIGVNTAGAILAYAFNAPTVFIETNIRTVYLHHFFKHMDNVADSVLLPHLVESVRYISDTGETSIREWYWALMDYGVYLKSSAGNASRRSKHHQSQSSFAGSRRQVRGKILTQLTEGNMSEIEIYQKLDKDARTNSVLEDLTLEGLIYKSGLKYRLGDGL